MLTWNEDLLASPVKVFPRGAVKWVNDAGNAVLLSTTNVVKIEHSLASLELTSINDASRLLGEQGLGPGGPFGLGLGRPRRESIPALKVKCKDLKSMYGKVSFGQDCLNCR